MRSDTAAAVAAGTGEIGLSKVMEKSMDISGEAYHEGKAKK